jgi:hypothetical protein
MRYALVLAMVWLTFHDGLRWEIGTDWIHYYDAFVEDDNEHMGAAYRFINRCFRLFTDNYSIFIFCFATFCYCILGKFLAKYSPNPIMSACIYYCSMIGLMGSNRQLLAMSICLLSLNYIFERKKKYFILSVLCATTIHLTAFSFLPAYYLFNLSYRKKTILLIAGCAFLVGVLHLVNKIPFVEYLALIDSMGSGTNLANYVDNFDSSVSVVGSIKRLLFVFLALYVRDYVNSKEYDFFLLLYVIGCTIYLIFNGSVLQVLAGRGAAYYNIYECVVVVYIILHFSADFFERQFLWFVLFAIYFYLMWRDMDFYVLMGEEDIYNPYKCVLFESVE